MKTGDVKRIMTGLARSTSAFNEGSLALRADQSGHNLLVDLTTRPALTFGSMVAVDVHWVVASFTCSPGAVKEWSVTFMADRHRLC